MRVVVPASALVLAIPVAYAAQTPAAETAIRGVVVDSLQGRGLSGATVQMAAAGASPWTRTVTTDSTGRFEVAGVPMGTYLIGFFHAKVDSLGIVTPTLRIDVRTAQPVEVRLGLPSPQTIARALCGRRAISDSTGLLIGYVRGADNSMPRANGSVLVRWSELIIERGSIQRTMPTVTASSGPTGLMAVCGVPIGTPLLLQASSATDSSGSFEVTVPVTGFLHRDVFVAPFQRATIATSDSGPPVELLRGSGRLRGRVVAANARPIPGARVMVWGTGIEGITDAEGVFRLGELPGGTHTLEVRAVGFSPMQQPVDIVRGAADASEVELANLGIMLDTVRVSTQRIFTSPRVAELERRLRSGMGHVMLEQEIAKRQVARLTDLLRSIPGVMVVPSRYSSEDVLMRGGEGVLGPGVCRPEIYIDGTRIVNDPSFPINSLVVVDEVKALEVYSRPASVPTELRSLSGCGVIGIWTAGSR